MADPAALKVPPHSIEAEQSVLGGLLLEGTAWDLVSDRLVDEDFYRQDHRLIYQAIRRVYDQGRPCDLITVAECLEQSEELDRAGGMAYLGLLAGGVASAVNIAAYADIVRERAIARHLISVGSNIADSGFHPQGRPVAELLDAAESQVFEIAERGARARSGFSAIKDLLPTVVERLDALYRSGIAMTGISTGFTDLDRMTSGMHPAEMIIVAGRPSMGKTSFAMNMVESVAIRARQPVAVFSMEMPAEQLALRMISSLGRVDAHRVRTGQLHDDDWPRVTSAVTLLGESNIFIDDTPSLSPMDLRARARRLKRQHGLGLIVVDYLQLMQVPGAKDNRVLEISEISRSLKALAKELSVPVIALSQLNRSLETRPNKRPVMSDLRESGAIEQDADVILFIYRDEVYNEDSPDKGKAEIIIAKQRNGPIGHLFLAFLGAYTRFEDLAQDYGGYD
ncbi:replicative DNA helicase [Immundisolibacter cernigliae]|uniref:Replicative DNA helicase n=1 Tax=Immundisolibacter cernigliae TaxID=1810504 RepID=A0A1B1YTR7_9GAMM|nr:replicative DNA helicase [Immundisolibacter cernigliae]ANX04053.1 replicative DNA helicase [Immundisolibacter cernigliae]